MKNKLFFGSLVLAMFAFTSCEGFVTSLNETIEDGLSGNASLTVTRESQDGTITDSLKFTSSIVDVFNLSEYDTTATEGHSTIAISANVDFGEADVELEFPFMYYRLNDSVTGAYDFDTIVTMQMLQNFDFASLLDILANPDGGNMMVLVENDSCWYVTYSGQFVVTEYPTVGHIVKGNFSNVEALYVTQSKVNELSNDIENMNYAHINDINYYFPRVTLSGTVSSRRWSVIHSIFNAAFLQGGMASK